MKIGLFFGTFNPVHVGHLIIANYMADYTGMDKVWLVVTPQNPLKKKSTLLEDYHRLALTRIAVEDNPKIEASNVEFDLPVPSYTIDTLTYLKESYPENEFALIMGEDNLRTIHKWKNFEQILEHHKILVYPRALTEDERNEMKEYTDKEDKYRNHPSVLLCDAPVMKLSATFIRNAIRENKDVRYLLTDPVYKYVTEMHFYE